MHLQTMSCLDLWKRKVPSRGQFGELVHPVSESTNDNETWTRTCWTHWKSPRSKHLFVCISFQLLDFPVRRNSIIVVYLGREVTKISAQNLGRYWRSRVRPGSH